MLSLKTGSAAAALKQRHGVCCITDDETRTERGSSLCSTVKVAELNMTLTTQLSRVHIDLCFSLCTVTVDHVWLHLDSLFG